MRVNRYKPHIFVLPEDRANEEIANGFIQAENVNFRAIQIERIANGWNKVVEKFNEQLGNFSITRGRQMKENVS